MVHASARHPAAAEAREGTPLLRIVGGRGGVGGTSALRSRAVVAVLVLGVVAGCACISMMARGSVQRFELAQQRAADMDLAAGSSGEGVKLQKEIDMARILWTKGEAEQEGGEKDIRNARMLAMQILAEAAEGGEGGGNATNGTDSTEQGLGPSLQKRGVNVNHWPFYEKYKHTPHVYNDTSPEAPNATADERDEENREGLEKRGVNVGRWFWEDKHFSDKDMGGGGDAENGSETGAAAAGNSTNSTEGDDEASPDDKLEKFGVNVDTTFWDGPPAAPPKVKLEHKAVGGAAFQQLYRKGGLDSWFDLRRRGLSREAEGREDGAMRRAVHQREGRYGRLTRP